MNQVVLPHSCILTLYSTFTSMRKWLTLPPVPSEFERKLTAWISKRKTGCVLRSNRKLFKSIDSYSSFEWCAAFDSVSEINASENAFGSLKKFHEEKQDWIFGFLTYDLKNELENLTSKNFDGLEFPSMHFFQPEYIFLKNESGIHFSCLSGDERKHLLSFLDEIRAFIIPLEEIEPEGSILPRVTRDDYVKSVVEIQKHIQRGDIYEMNYCVEFYGKGKISNPSLLYEKLNELSPMPFSCFYRNDNRFLISASPERFIAKRKTKIISQPIKGTARRGSSEDEDKQIIDRLRNDEKEKSENVMIVDLVRNDLSRTAKRKSVHVEELFGIYTFRQLHQMISTVVSEMKDDVHWTDVIRSAFPMGSMTGAPKIRAMELIDEFENTKRGLYSGAVGYVTPEGDFDFNVVIRSILYNELKNYISFMVGSAITISSDPVKEYDECMLKAEAMMNVLKGKIPATNFTN
jgi:para-aminobenzoate synthetase component 1